MKWRERGTAVFLGVLATFLLLEGGLRLVGWVAHGRAISGAPRHADGAYTVMCVGDSFTWGYWGLLPHESYPAQLEKVCESELGPGRVRVVNRGESGQNTFQVLGRLDADLALVRPDAVVVLAGGANDWDLFSYYRYCEGDSWASRVKDSLYRLRIFKLAKLLARDVESRTRPSPGVETAVFGVSHYSVKGLRLMRQTTIAGQVSYDRGMACWSATGQIRRRDVAGAEACFRDSLRWNPDSLGAWLNLGWLKAAQGDAEGTISCFLKAHEINARQSAGRAARLVSIKIVKCLQVCVSVHPEWRPLALARFQEAARSHPEVREDCESFSRATAPGPSGNASTQAWISSDLVKIIRRCQEHGAVVLLQNYPRYDPTLAMPWEQMLPELARENGALFVDQRSVFDPMPNRAACFAEDRSHPNAAGNRVMAENVYRVLAPLVPRTTPRTAPRTAPAEAGASPGAR